MSKRAALYLRVSTGDRTLDNQRRDLTTAAAARGWDVVKVYEDFGISGAKGRDQRAGLDAMLKGATRRQFDVAMAWSVDRLGRSLADLVNGLQELHAAGVDLYLDKQALDTTTPSGKAMFQMAGVFAEFERSMIQARVRAGMARAQAEQATGKLRYDKHGVRKKRIGRPETSPVKIEAIRAQLAAGTGILKTARLCGVGTGVVQKVAIEIRAATA